jgi:hypothetical protein
MHELGHSFGLADFCGSDSIMNTGATTCNNGTWLQVMAFLANDRGAIMAIYPNIPYP